MNLTTLVVVNAVCENIWCVLVCVHACVCVRVCINQTKIYMWLCVSDMCNVLYIDALCTRDCRLCVCAFVLMCVSIVSS